MNADSPTARDSAVLAGMERFIKAMRGMRPDPPPSDDEGGAEVGTPEAGPPSFDTSGLRRLRAALEPTSLLERGVVIGRHMVLQRLGAGGMGVVYAAYDPELDRKVALKVLLSDVAEDAGGARLRREAQALGKLAHPNVVTVHDMGIVGDQVWLAMELVDGLTLRQWLSTPRGWREVLEVLRDAGKGLAAAHAAGLLHRDFKPENVMVGDDGRVRVMDFGLARARPMEVPTEPKDSRLMPTIDTLGMEVTQADEIIGTPCYMAPEQLRSGELTTAADQFAFCVTLWEALYGERPFAGRTLAALVVNVLDGRLRSPSKGHRVPARLHRALLRGLAREPEARWSSMACLLDELQRVSRPRLRWWTSGITVAGIVAAGAAGAWHYTLVGRLCDGIDRHLDGVWDDTRRSEVRDAILSTDRPYAAEAWRRAEQSLDAYRDGWVAMRTETCEATNVHGEQSVATHDLKVQCLDEHRMALEGTVDVLSVAGDERIAERAVVAVEELPPLERCSDVARLRADVPLPEDPEAVAEVWTLRERLAEAAANLELARHDEALAIVEDVMPRVERLGHAPLVAEARLRRGLGHAARDLDAAEHDLREAHLLALELGRDHVAAEAAEALASVVGVAQLRYAEGMQWARTGLALAERLRDHTRAVGQMGVLAELLVRSGRPAEGLVQYRMAWDRYVRSHAPTMEVMHASAIAVTAGMGRVLVELDESEQALGVFQIGLEAAVRKSGEEHPMVVEHLAGMGLALLEQSKLAEASAHLELAWMVGDDVMAREDPRAIDPAVALCRSTMLEGRHRVGVARCRRALRAASSSLGETHPRTAVVRSALGWSLLLRGQPAEALAEQRSALEHAEAALDRDHVVLGRILLELAETELALSDARSALEHSQRAVEIGERVYGLGHTTVGWGLRTSAEAMARLGDAEGARTAYERALAVLEVARGDEHPDTIRTTLGLARVLARLGRSDRALEIARRAVALLESVEAPPSLMAEARAMLEGNDAFHVEAHDGG
jgi:tetratricopeptide (TPR) repeat protein